MEFNNQLVYEKGKVVEVNSEYAIVMTETFQFVKVEMKGKMRVGQSIFFTNIDIIHEQPKIIKNKYWMAKAVAAILVLSIVINSTMNFGRNKVYAAISVDINPSIVFEINDAYEVLSYKSFNEEGSQLLLDSYIGKDISFALNQVLEQAEESRYLNEDKNTVLIASTVLQDDDDTNRASDKLENHIVKHIKAQEVDLNLVVIEASAEDYSKSKGEDKSLGRYEIEHRFENGENKSNKNIDDLFENGFFNRGFDNAPKDFDVDIIQKEKPDHGKFDKENHPNGRLNQNNSHDDESEGNEDELKGNQDKSKEHEDKSKENEDKIKEYDEKSNQQEVNLKKYDDEENKEKKHEDKEKKHIKEKPDHSNKYKDKFDESQNNKDKLEKSNNGNGKGKNKSDEAHITNEKEEDIKVYFKKEDILMC